MPDGPDNPLAAGFFNLFTNGAVRQSFQVDPSVNGDSPLGTIVEILDFAGPGTTARQTVPTVQPCSLGADARAIGAITGGTDLKGDPSVEPGQVAMVTVVGICQVLIDATVVAGEALVLSPSTAGCARTSASPSTRTLGLCLESVTVSSGTDLAWAYIGVGTEGGEGGGGSFPTFTGAGSPEGVQTANPGQTYQDTNTGALYIQPGASDTGWELFAGSAQDIGSILGIGTDGGGDLIGFAPAALDLSAGTTAALTAVDGVTVSTGAALIEINAGSGSSFTADTGQDAEIGSAGGSMILTVKPDGIGTTPLDSHTATTTLGQPVIGTPLHNTLDYDVAYSVVVPITASTGGSLTMGVASTNTPTADPASPALTGAATVTLSGILPAGYYLLIDTSGTITAGTPVAVYTPV